jgi:hypothetical protein
MAMEQMMARLLAEIKTEITTNQAKTDADLRERGEEMTARLEAMIQNQEKRSPT